MRPEDFNRMVPHKPRDLSLPTAILYKMNGCGWCTKMEAEWDDVADQVLYANVCHFTTDKNNKHSQHWTKIENSLETEIEGFPAVMFYSPDGQVILHTGYSPVEEMIPKMKAFFNKPYNK